MNPAKAAEWIEVLFGLETLTWNILLNGDPGFPHEFSADFAKLLCPLVLQGAMQWTVHIAMWLVYTRDRTSEMMTLLAL